MEFEQKYQTFSAKDLKKALKKLKLENGDVLEIKFVTKKLRTLLDKRNNTDQHDANTYESAEINHDRLIKINFWGYVKKYFKKIQVLFQHLTWVNAHHISLKHFQRLTRVKHLASSVEFQNLLLPRHRLTLNPRPIKRLQMSSVK